MRFSVIISCIWLWTNTSAFTNSYTSCSSVIRNHKSSCQMHHPNTSRFKNFRLNSASLVDLSTEKDSKESKVAGTGTDDSPAPKSYLDDGFVFGLEGSGLVRPKGKVAQIVVEGDSLETKPHQVAIVTFTFLNHFLFLLHSIAQLNQINHGNISLTAIQSFLTIFSSWVLADLGSGVLHWSVDNYGNGRTPIMGGIIAAFQGHHTAPWTITERGFCNNVWKLCIPFGIPTVALISILSGPSHPIISLFFTVFCTMEILSQEFHKWSHMTTSQLHPIVRTLQKYGITIDRTPHAKHHLAPFEGNYCIISGICNEPLDKSGFFRRLEKFVYDVNGVESNAWKLDPELRAKTLRGDYSL